MGSPGKDLLGAVIYREHNRIEELAVLVNDFNLPGASPIGINVLAAPRPPTGALHGQFNIRHELLSPVPAVMNPSTIFGTDHARKSVELADRGIELSFDSLRRPLSDIRPNGETMYLDVSGLSDGRNHQDHHEDRHEQGLLPILQRNSPFECRDKRTR